MKKILFVTIWTISASAAYSQNYHPLVASGKLWSTLHFYGSLTQGTSDYIRLDGDTAINGDNYKKVFRCLDQAQTNWLQYGFIREDENKRVYYLSWAGGAPNNLLYDFSANTGDTIYPFSDPMGAYMVVNSVGTATLLTGETRRQLNLTGYTVNSPPLGQDTWIEGIGSLYGVLQSGSCILVGDNPKLLCCHENDTLKYFNSSYSSCYVITGVEVHQNDNLVKVFPNPDDGSVSISVNNREILPIEIVFSDAAGKTIMTGEMKDNHMTIDLTGSEIPLVIIYTLHGNTGFVSSGKIILLRH